MNNTVRVSNQKYIDYMIVLGKLKGIGEGKINALIEFKAEIKKINKRLYEDFDKYNSFDRQSIITWDCTYKIARLCTRHDIENDEFDKNVLYALL